jgi:hypothetical protein
MVEEWCLEMMGLCHPRNVPEGGSSLSNESSDTLGISLKATITVARIQKHVKRLAFHLNLLVSIHRHRSMYPGTAPCTIGRSS